jgi:hypothetical protein
MSAAQKATGTAASGVDVLSPRARFPTPSYAREHEKPGNRLDRAPHSGCIRPGIELEIGRAKGARRMSITPLSSSQTTNNLITELVAAMDGNQDGQISTSEFTGFLTKVLAAASNGTAKVSTSGTTGATDVVPSTWTDNNAPYGVTFAGFSPQNHTNLTLADLANPMNAKYAAYNYLLSNQVVPNQTWAPAAADALNQKYGTTIFHAIDGETLGYGDEYIHSAPNGYGMSQGTYSPTATGEFLWGAVQA